MPITKGFATWLGTIGAAAGVLIPLLADLQGAADPLGAPAAVWVVAGAVLACLVVVGRMAQAVALTVWPPAVDDTEHAEELPDHPTDVSVDQL